MGWASDEQRRAYHRAYKKRPYVKVKQDEWQRHYLARPEVRERRRVMQRERLAAHSAANTPSAQKARATAKGYRASPMGRLQVMLNEARRRARRKGVPCTITRSDIRAAYPIDGRCSVFGVPFATKGHSASLDELIKGRGYVTGNITVISWRANRIKNDGTAAEHAAIATWMQGMGAL